MTHVKMHLHLFGEKCASQHRTAEGKKLYSVGSFTFASWEPLSNGSRHSPTPSLKHILNGGRAVFSRRMCPTAPWKLHFVSLVQLVNDGPFWLNIQFPFINHVFLVCQFSPMITEPFHADVHRHSPRKTQGRFSI